MTTTTTTNMMLLLLIPPSLTDPSPRPLKDDGLSSRLLYPCVSSIFCFIFMFLPNFGSKSFTKDTVRYVLASGYFFRLFSNLHI